MDVRWSGKKKVVVAAFKEGTHELSISQAGLEDHQIVGVFPNFGIYGAHVHLGLELEWLALGGPARAIFWRPTEATVEKPPHVNDLSLDGIVDLDVHAGQLVILGTRRGPSGEYSPDGIIGWRATLGAHALDYQPFFEARSGPKARAMARCGIMDPGKVRFLADGSYLFVPGVEPGVFQFGPSGKLVQYWDTADLGIDAECNLDQKTFEQYSLNQVLREKEWINKRKIVDEILPLPSGPGLVIRRQEDDLIRWQLKILHSSGEVTAEELPIASHYPITHLKGDVRDDGALVFLASQTYARDLQPEGPTYIFVSKKALPAPSSPPP